MKIDKRIYKKLQCQIKELQKQFYFIDKKMEEVKVGDKIEKNEGHGLNVIYTITEIKDKEFGIIKVKDEYNNIYEINIID